MSHTTHQDTAQRNMARAEHNTHAELVSAGIDGEVDDQELAQLLDLYADTAHAQRWQIGHIIGDTLRETPVLSSGIARRVAEQLADEPTILAPRHRSPTNRSRLMNKYFMPLAASVAAIAVVSWSALHIPVTGQTPVQVASIAPTTQPAKIDQVRLHSYMAAHRDFSPGADSPLMDATYQVPAEPAR